MGFGYVKVKDTDSVLYREHNMSRDKRSKLWSICHVFCWTKTTTPQSCQ